MPKRLLIAIWLVVGLWAAGLNLLAAALPPGLGDPLGFVGTLLPFYPTAITELRMWLARCPPGATAPPAAPPGGGDKAAGLLGEIEEALRAAIGRFSYLRAALYGAGRSLIALGFGAGRLG